MSCGKIAILVTILALQEAKGDAPEIKWRSCDAEETGAYHACMQVKFKNGVEDTMVLNKYMGFDTVLMGALKNEPDVSVAVSAMTDGDWSSKAFQVSFISVNEPTCTVFDVAADGTTACAKKDEAFNIADGEVIQTDYVYIPEEVARKLGDWTFLPSDESRALDPNGYSLTLMAFYDDNMVKKFGSAQGAEARIVAAVAHANTLFKLPSLNTRVKITLVGQKHLPGKTWVATGADLGAVSQNAISAGAANAYFFFGYENDAPGTVGIAYFASTCSGLQDYQTGIVEYFKTDAKTGAVLAHELGHNLGMRHDFLTTVSDARKADDGTSCTNINGIMDYGAVQSIWSKCSLEDFTTYVDSNQPFCLATLSSDGSTTPSTTSTTKSNCFDRDDARSCNYNKSRSGCKGQLWNEVWCKKTCGLC